MNGATVVQGESPVTLLPAAVCHRLYEDPALGCGNFLAKVRAASPFPAVDFLFLEEPIALTDGTTRSSLSLDAMFALTRHLANWYLAREVKAADVVCIYATEGIPAFLHYLALTSIGAIPALINPAMRGEIAAAYIQQNNFTRVLADSAVLKAKLRAHLPAEYFLDYPGAFPSSDATPTPAWWPYRPDDSTIVMLCHSSGTTGLPKAVQFGHHQFFVGKRERLKQFVESPDDKMLSGMPHSHSAGISYLMTATLLGMPTFVLSNPVGEGVHRQLHRFLPTIVAGFPQTYVSLAASAPAAGEFHFVRRWFCMGDAAHETHIRIMLAASPKSRFIDTFGSSELGMALFRRESTIKDVARRRSIGRAVEFADARILDPGTFSELPAESVGLMAVRSKTLTAGYWQRPDLTAAACRNGYWLTGDVGFQSDGEFFQLDRTVDVIHSSAGPLYTLLLEEEVQQIDGVCDVSVVGCVLGGQSYETVVALVLPKQDWIGESTVQADRIIEAIMSSPQLKGKLLPPDVVCVAIAHDASNFPCGSTGKVLKMSVRDSFPEVYRDLCEAGTARGGIAVVRRSGEEPDAPHYAVPPEQLQTAGLG